MEEGKVGKEKEGGDWEKGRGLLLRGGRDVKGVERGKGEKGGEAKGGKGKGSDCAVVKSPLNIP